MVWLGDSSLRFLITLQLRHRPGTQFYFKGGSFHSGKWLSCCQALGVGKKGLTTVGQ